MTRTLGHSLLNLVLGATAYAAPGTLHFGAFTAKPDRTLSNFGSGYERSGGGYARVAVANTPANFTNVAGGKTNGTDIVFPTATALWGNIVGIGLFNASGTGTTDTLLWYADIPTTLVNINDRLIIPAGSLTFTME